MDVYISTCRCGLFETFKYLLQGAYWHAFNSIAVILEEWLKISFVRKNAEVASVARLVVKISHEVLLQVSDDSLLLKSSTSSFERLPSMGRWDVSSGTRLSNS